jgi:hypothetical protein
MAAHFSNGSRIFQVTADTQGMAQSTNQPTNQLKHWPAEPAWEIGAMADTIEKPDVKFRDHINDSLAEFEKKIRRAERAQVCAYLKTHADMNILELADAIAAGVHLRPVVPVVGPDPRD